MIILGLNAYHADAAAALVRDGEVAAAAEEERFRRIKHWAGFPAEAVRFCLSDQGLSLADVDCIAINSQPRAALMRRIGYAIRQRPDPRLVLDRLRTQSKRLALTAELARAFPGQVFKGRFARVEHHRAHLASSFLASPFEEAAVLSVDGMGDFASAAWGSGRGQHIAIDGRISFPHSLGLFYQAITQHLGFWNYGDEYKVMGLAPYGRPVLLEDMRQIVRLEGDGRFALALEYFRHHRERIAYDWEGGAPSFSALFSPALEGLLGPARRRDEEISDHHRNIACSAQAMYEIALFQLLDALHARHPIDALALSGGCAMNSVANGKIARQTGFKTLYVPPAAGDAGGAIGAALDVWSQHAPERSQVRSAALGSRVTNSDVAALLERQAGTIETAHCETRVYHDPDELCEQAAKTIAAGGVVGWFQGRMEWGPRALGHRSILADPRRSDMKDILNHKIKRRESFRPFAPSILAEHTNVWFETDASIPFMSEVHPVRAEKRGLIPAVTHVDGSGRLQTVDRAVSPLYWQLIDTFYRLTGVPMILNTSFNENEPVVCRPEEALDCFLRTKMDMLVIEQWIIRRGAA